MSRRQQLRRVTLCSTAPRSAVCRRGACHTSRTLTAPGPALTAACSRHEPPPPAKHSWDRLRLKPTQGADAIGCSLGSGQATRKMLRSACRTLAGAHDAGDATRKGTQAPRRTHQPQSQRTRGSKQAQQPSVPTTRRLPSRALPRQPHGATSQAAARRTYGRCDSCAQCPAACAFTHLHSDAASRAEQLCAAKACTAPLRRDRTSGSWRSRGLLLRFAAPARSPAAPARGAPGGPRPAARAPASPPRTRSAPSAGAPPRPRMTAGAGDQPRRPPPPRPAAWRSQRRSRARAEGAAVVAV